MLQLSKNRCTQISTKLLNDGILSFEKRKNVLYEVTSKESNIVFRLKEDGYVEPSHVRFTEILDVSLKMKKEEKSLIGSECHSCELKGCVGGAADILCISRNNSGRTICFVADMKHSFGKDYNEILRFVKQCSSTMKFALGLCYIVEENVESIFDFIRSMQINFCIITENFCRNELVWAKQNCENSALMDSSMIGQKMCAQNREGDTKRQLLENLLNGKFPFQGRLFDLDVREMLKGNHYAMKLDNGHVDFFEPVL